MRDNSIFDHLKGSVVPELHRFIDASHASYRRHISHPQMRELFKMAEVYSDKMSECVTLSCAGNPVPKLLLQSSMTTFMSAFQLAFSGHTAAVHATARAALEAALYGYVISKGDDHFERWKTPPKDPRYKIRASEAFRFLEQEGIKEHGELKASYEALIARGAHPNKPSVALHTTSTARDEGFEMEFTAIYAPSDSSASHIASAIGPAALTMVIAGATLLDCRERLFQDGRALYKRLLDYLEANATPPSPALNGAPTKG